MHFDGLERGPFSSFSIEMMVAAWIVTILSIILVIVLVFEKWSVGVVGCNPV